MIYNILFSMMLIISIGIVIAIFMQPSKQDGAINAFSGGTEELIDSHKSRGAEFMIRCFTSVMIVFLLVISLSLVILSAY
ncbi:MAG: preprotein translocase subunit SecG [Streptococcaceae bacterium]|nr:preprotein translocase subunit SecG [Streptococcaceae bacterium]